MLYISYGSVCELETQILLAGDLGCIEKGELGTAKKDIAETETRLKALITFLEIKNLHFFKAKAAILDPWHLLKATAAILGPFSPTRLEKNLIFIFIAK